MYSPVLTVELNLLAVGRVARVSPRFSGKVVIGKLRGIPGNTEVILRGIPGNTEVILQGIPIGIYTGLLSVGQYPAHIWQSPMNAMCWLESWISNGNVIIHPAEPGVLLRQVERIKGEYSLLILSTCLIQQRTPGSVG